MARTGAPPDNADDADAIIFLEPAYTKLLSYYEALATEPLLRRHPNRCFVIDSADTAWGLMPGVYTHLKASQVDRARFRSGGFMHMYNKRVDAAVDRAGRESPWLLFSFRGSASAPLRRELFALEWPQRDVAVSETHKWFTHSEEEKQAYVDEVLSSKFVLCPRGLGTATFRCFEAMQLGRVPVILSDEWVPPEGPAWPDFAIRVAESRVAELYDAPDVVLLRAINSIEAILLERSPAHDEARLQDWFSSRSLWKLGWTRTQRFARMVRDGSVFERATLKLRQRLVR